VLALSTRGYSVLIGLLLVAAALLMILKRIADTLEAKPIAVSLTTTLGRELDSSPG
jgi:hypothetical protein